MMKHALRGRKIERGKIWQQFIPRVTGIGRIPFCIVTAYGGNQRGLGKKNGVRKMGLSTGVREPRFLATRREQRHAAQLGGRMRDDPHFRRLGCLTCPRARA